MQTNQTRNQVLQKLHRLPKMLAGTAGDASAGGIEELLRDLGLKALQLIHEAFLIKSKGGSDAAGITWPRQSPAYVAYGRDHGRPTKRVGERPRGLLTEAQDRRWRAIFATKARHFTAAGSADPEGDAARVAWAVLKSQGAATMLEVFGSRQVDILIKSGDLLGSLTPNSGHPDQIFEVDAAHGRVAVGSKLPHAGAHHHGAPGKGLPQRALWPDPDNLPQEWQDAFGQLIASKLATILGKAVA